MNVKAEELSTLRAGDDVALLVLPDDDYDDDEAIVVAARVAYVELREAVGFAWAQHLDGGRAPALRVGRSELASGYSDQGGVQIVRLCLPTSTGVGEWVWLVLDRGSTE